LTGPISRSNFAIPSTKISPHGNEAEISKREGFCGGG
jgi:hypothetical protein